MATPFLGQLMLVSFSYAPKGFALCNGQLLPINQNQALFALLGTTYGGNGQTTFALPNLQGRVGLGVGNGYSWGQAAGAEAVTLTAAQMPGHTHTLTVSSAGSPQLSSPAGNTVGTTAEGNYSTTKDGTAMDAGTITATGGGTSHENRSPYLVLNWVIALQGIFPSRN